MKKVVVLMMAAAMLVLTGCGRSNEQIIADVKPLVTQISQRVYSSAECTQILDIQKVDSDHYTATAEVEFYRNEFAQRLNAKSKEHLRISIAYDKDQVLVRVIQ